MNYSVIVHVHRLKYLISYSLLCGHLGAMLHVRLDNNIWMLIRILLVLNTWVLGQSPSGQSLPWTVDNHTPRKITPGQTPPEMNNQIMLFMETITYVLLLIKLMELYENHEIKKYVSLQKISCILNCCSMFNRC